MKLKFYFSVLFLFAFFVSSGQKHIVRGVIRDSVNNETIPYANVIMYGLADNYMGGVVSDSLGRFNICIDSVDHIKFSHIEYVRKDIKISSIKGKDFCILLSRNDVMLEGVNIISKIKAKEGFNTLQYNFSNSITDSILFSENLLKLIPCIDVSPNGPLRVNGNSNVSYTINGKPADQKQIESLPSSIIKSVELKTVPDAYLLNMGAQSAINIITKAKEKGSLDVLINPFATTNLRLINSGAAINYFYKKMRFGLRANYWNQDISKNGKKNLTSSIGNYSYLNSKSVSDTDKELWFDFDLFLTPDKIFNNSIYVSNYKLRSTGKNRDNNQLMESFASLNKSKTFLNSTYFSNNMSLSSYSIMFDLYSYSGVLQDSLHNINLGSVLSNTNVDKKYSKIKLDYTMKRDSWKLNIINESKYQVNKYSNNTEINEYDIYTNTFNISAYKKLNDKLTIQAAVAHNFRQIASNSTKNVTNNILPVVSLYFKINGNENLSLSYSAIQNNPSTWQMNPILSQSEEYIYTKGNSSLSSEIIKSVSLYYTRNNKPFYSRSTLSYTEIKNKIIDICYPQNDSIIRTYVNHPSSRVLKFGNFSNIPVKIINVRMMLSNSISLSTFDQQKYYPNYKLTYKLEYTPKKWYFSSSFNFTSKIYQPKITVKTLPSVGLQMYKRIGNLLLGCEIFVPFNKTLTISDAAYDDIYIYNRTNSNCKYLGFSIKYRFKTAKGGDIIDRDLNIESDKF